MKLGLDLKTSLTQTLTPQQIQYLKLLQLPLIQLEQQVQQELEQNPMLEEFDTDMGPADDAATHDDYDSEEGDEYETSFAKNDEDKKSAIDDTADPFEFYKMVWQDDSDYSVKSKGSIQDDDDNEPFQIKDNITFVEELSQQLRMLHLTDEQFFLGEQIIGNVDNDGYLRRDLQEIVDETNTVFAEFNFEAQKRYRELTSEVAVQAEEAKSENPARQYAISDDVLAITKSNGTRELQPIQLSTVTDDAAEEKKIDIKYMKPVTVEDAEVMLIHIQSLDPPGIASRDIRECLLAQCKVIPKPNAAQKLAIELLENAYEAFTMKHYQVITKQFEVSEEYLKEAIEFIRTLNPKPGGGDFQSEINTVIPDFMIERDEDTNELLITVNDSRIPTLKLSSAFEKIKKEAKYKLFNKETREWLRNKYDDAKFLIQAIRQRKSTMLKVMTAIAGLQRGFFDLGSDGLRPLIYKDVAENTGLDISTVCRIVNGKYVQTEFGTYELKFFFSESLPSEDGTDVSTTVIKNVIKDIISEESKKKPLSDDKIAKELKDKGYNVARRTVAKYREQLKIPVARLRKEL